jgi:hypothetical protein
MHKFLSEYGRLVVAIIALSGFFVLLGVLLSDKDVQDSMKNIVSENEQDSTALFENTDDYSSAIVGDTVESDTVPYFKIADDINLGIIKTAFTYDDALTDVRAYYKGEDITALSKTSDNKDVKLTIMAYQYIPVIEKSEGDINGTVVMEEVYAKDKYGHYIYAEDGVTKLKTTQPKYDISDAVKFTKKNYIDTTATNYKIKLVYRVQVGTYKAECEVFYLKNTVGATVDTSGLTALEFN